MTVDDDYFPVLVGYPGANRPTIDVEFTDSGWGTVHALSIDNKIRLYDFRVACHTERTDVSSCTMIHRKGGSPCVGVINGDIDVPCAADGYFMLFFDNDVYACGFDNSKSFNIGAGLSVGFNGAYYRNLSCNNSTFTGLDAGIVNDGSFDVTATNNIVQNNSTFNFYNAGSGSIIQNTNLIDAGVTLQADGIHAIDAAQISGGTDMSASYTDDIDGVLFSAWQIGANYVTG